ncbi:MAG: hypothetical protein U1F27_00120 [Turneriella sp.]
MKRIALPLLCLWATFSIEAVSEIYSGSPQKKKDVVHPDLKLFHPKITPEFLSSFKPTELDFQMEWVIVDESARKYPEK